MPPRVLDFVFGMNLHAPTNVRGDAQARVARLSNFFSSSRQSFPLPASSAMPDKTCSRCLKTKPESEFPLRKRKKEGADPRIANCAECDGYSQDRAKLNKEKAARYVRVLSFVVLC